jgi:uroporphyrinogen decarboxylase
LHSRYIVASGCEVPPSLSTKLENIKAVVDTTKKYGQITC